MEPLGSTVTIDRPVDLDKKSHIICTANVDLAFCGADVSGLSYTNLPENNCAECLVKAMEPGFCPALGICSCLD